VLGAGPDMLDMPYPRFVDRTQSADAGAADAGAADARAADARATGAPGLKPRGVISRRPFPTTAARSKNSGDRIMQTKTVVAIGATWLFILVAVAANVATNASLKLAAKSIQGETVAAKLWSVLFTPYFWIGCAAGGVLVGSYMLALRALPVSTAYILVTSLAVVGLYLVDNLFFGTALSWKNLAGAALVLLGVALVSQ